MPGRDEKQHQRGDEARYGGEATQSAADAPEQPVPGAKRAEREARLAQQLRANLQRRKQQARGRAAGQSSDLAPEPSGEGS